MCGRFTLTASGEELAEAFDLDEPPTLEPRYNIAPSQDVLAVSAGADGRRRTGVLRWGFVPERGPSGRPVINARAETAWSRPMFSAAFARRRCLLPADGFYEWQVVPGARRKQPHHIRLSPGRAHGPGRHLGAGRGGPGHLRDPHHRAQPHARGDPRPHARDRPPRSIRDVARPHA